MSRKWRAQGLINDRMLMGAGKGDLEDEDRREMKMEAYEW